MKKIVPTALLFCLVCSCLAQQRIGIPQSYQDIMATGAFSAAVADIPANASKEINRDTFGPGQEGQSEEEIGYTWYDQQSNAHLSNRIHRFQDGSIGAVWTMGFDIPGFADRGTGYNYFDGTVWDTPPTARIENDRTGWPSYAPWGADGEIVVAHISGGASEGLLINKRVTKGTGAWQQLLFQGPLPDWKGLYWPRMTASGSNSGTTHLLSLTIPTGNGGQPYMGQDGALLYNRSQDGGQTWDIQHQILPGTGSSYYNFVQPDCYAWAESKENTIAFLVADSWMDMFVMKSTDNGDNWTKLMVWEHPYPFFDWNTTITTDTLWAPDRSADITIDNSGKVHVVCGLMRVAHFEFGTTFQYWPFTDGIAYWNEDRPPFTAPDQHDALDAEDVLIENHNLIGWTQDVNNNGTIDFMQQIMSYREMGISTMPEIISDDYNNLFLVYASTTETYDNGTYNFKHIWARGSNDNGLTWGSFLDLNTDLIHIFDECIYPVVAGSSDDKIHLIYNVDPSPGLAVNDDHPYQQNRIFFLQLDKSDLITYQPGISSFPYTESFENGAGAWQQCQGDDFDWTNWSGNTPSSGTGPAAAHDGTFYMYTEASAPNNPYKTAGLRALFNFSQVEHPFLSFHYHMYGSNMGTLKLQVSIDGGTSWTDLWIMSGDQGDQWLEAAIDLATYAYESSALMRFWGETGDGYRSDMAVDMIEVSNTTLPVCVAPVYPPDEAVDVEVDPTFEWTASPQAEGYLIYLGTDNPPTNIENGTDLGNVLNYSPPSSLAYGADHYWKIVPYNQAGPAVSCPVWAFTTMDFSYQLDLKVYLEGPYLGPYMSTVLNIVGYVPLNQPYNVAPWNYFGTESVVEIPGDDVVDWALIELRDAPDASSATSSASIAFQAGFVLKDGSVRGVDGSSFLTFNVPFVNNLFVVVWHRNHLAVISAYPLTGSGSVFSYDFSVSANAAYGGAIAHKDLGGGVWGMVGGDGLPDGQIGNTDKIDVWIPQSGNSGYYQGDFTLDGQVNNNDKVDVWSVNSGWSSQVPN